MSGFYGHQSKLMIGTSSTPNVGLDFLTETLRKRKTMVDLNGMKGTRSRFGLRARPGVLPCSGSLVLHPTPVELATLLPLILGGTPSGTSYPLAETLTTFNYWALRGTKIYKYAGVGVSRATFAASQGEGLTLALDLVAKTEDNATASSSFPSFSIDQTTFPFMFHELVLIVDGITYKCKSFSLTIENAIDAGRFFNSQSLVTVQPTDRVITLSHDLPFGDAEDAYEIDQQSGVAGTLTFTVAEPATSLAFALPFLQYEPEAAVAADRGEVMLPLTAVARTTAALGELTVTMDSTP